MKRKIKSIAIALTLLLMLVIYNNSYFHLSQYKWKFFDETISSNYEDLLYFGKGAPYKYKWPYIYKQNEEIGYLIFCFGDKLWMYYLCEDSSNVVEYIGK